jgi:hypothetical protein
MRGDLCWASALIRRQATARCGMRCRGLRCALDARVRARVGRISGDYRTILPATNIEIIAFLVQMHSYPWDTPTARPGSQSAATPRASRKVRAGRRRRAAEDPPPPCFDLNRGRRGGKGPRTGAHHSPSHFFGPEALGLQFQIFLANRPRSSRSWGMFLKDCDVRS